MEPDISQFLRSLPKHSPLCRDDLLVDALLLYRDAAISVYFAPFDRVNMEAKIALIGITPGFQQMELLFRAKRDSIPNPHLFASFAGPMRSNLLSMLDSLNLNNLLHIDSCSQLFSHHPELLHTTSVVRHPVFLASDLTKNYAGYAPRVLKHSLLRKYVIDTLALELESVGKALLVPLGRVASECLRFLCESGRLDPLRCLSGIPHPSGANGHRVKQFSFVRDDLRRKAQQYLGKS